MRSLLAIFGLALAACVGGGMEVPCEPVPLAHDGRPCNYRIPAGVECASIVDVTSDGRALAPSEFSVICGTGVLVLRTQDCGNTPPPSVAICR